MSERISHSHSPPCLWMSAGLLSYRLCDRDFDCDNCPLDAALRGRGSGMYQDRQLQVPALFEADFPEDRLYTVGHLWIQRLERRGGIDLARCGLDVFAAAILGHCGGINRRCIDDRLETGEVLCDIDFGLGSLPFCSPIRGVFSTWNTTLCEQPDRVVTSPYDEGWIVELCQCEETAVDGLLSAQTARERSRFDLKRFRRRLAIHTLADEDQRLGPTMADGGELVADLRQILGGTAYTQMLHELIH